MGVAGITADHPLHDKLNLTIFIDVVYAMSIFFMKGE